MRSLSREKQKKLRKQNEKIQKRLERQEKKNKKAKRRFRGLSRLRSFFTRFPFARGIRKQVLISQAVTSIFPIVIFVIISFVFIQAYYYDSVKQSLISMVDYTKGVYNTTGTFDSSTLENKVNAIYDRQKNSKTSIFGVTFIDTNRNIVLDEYGIKSVGKAKGEDITNALKDSNSLVPYVDKSTYPGERIMCVSVPIKINSVVRGAIRYSVSLSKIDRQIWAIVKWISFIGAIIALFSLLLSFQVANRILRPIADLTKYAKKIERGEYDLVIDEDKITDDEVRGLFAAFQDMSREINKTSKLKDEFVASASHELRTPLTTIKGWIETIGMEGISEQDKKVGITFIQEETDRLIKIVNEMLDLSKYTNGQLTISQINVEQLVSSIVNQFRVKALEKNLRLSHELGDAVIEPIEADKDKLSQVLINLIQNSIKFTEPGGFVNVKIRQDKINTYFMVRDNGIGISKNNIAKVTDKFFQEDPTKQGTGLGLSITNQIINMHGGSLRISSDKNEGTTMFFRIPNKHISIVDNPPVKTAKSTFRIKTNLFKKGDNHVSDNRDSG